MRLAKALFIILCLLMFIQPVRAAREPLAQSARLGGRIAALGGAGVALPGSAESVFCNPAALVSIGWPELAAGIGNQDLGDLRQVYGAGALPLVAEIVTGIGWLKLNYPRGSRDDFDAYLFSAAFPISRNRKFIAGITGKYLRQEIPGITGTAAGGGMDIGLIYNLFSTSQGTAMSFGVSMLDAQTILKSPGQEISLPNVFRFGVALNLSSRQLLVIGLDAQESRSPGFDSFRVFRAGWEQIFRGAGIDELATRLGYLQRLDQSGLITAGLGVAFNNLRFDYAFQLPVYFSDAFHQISISWGFQRKEKKMTSKKDIKPELRVTPTPEPEEVELSNLFSALESAAGMWEEMGAEEESRPIPAATPKTRELIAAEEEPDYHYGSMPVPEGPADRESVSFGAVPEMPAIFSGYFSGGKGGLGGFDLVNQALRLHVVVNPFSPNNDGRQDKTIFVGRLVAEKLRVSRWVLNVVREGRVAWTFEGGSRLPRNLEWDGRDQQGRILPDGAYQVLLRIIDLNGMEIGAAAQTVEIKTKARAVSFSGPESVILTGTRKDKPLDFIVPEIRGSQDWKFTIFSPGQKKVYEKSGGEEVPQKIKWTPRVRGGAAPAGRYRARLKYRDEIGLQSESTVRFRIKYAEFSVSLMAADQLFMPRKSGGQGVNLQPKVQGNTKIKRWTLKIMRSGRTKPIRTYGGEGRPPKNLLWDGDRSDGKPVQGGNIYRAVLTVVSGLRTTASAESTELQCDLGAYTGKKTLSINLVRVRFKSGAADLDEASQRALIRAAETLGRYKTDFHLKVTGHCDPAESKGKQVELSRDRAQIVAGFMKKQGKITPDKIQTVGRGSQQPLSREDTGPARAKNRRVEVVLFAK